MENNVHALRFLKTHIRFILLCLLIGGAFGIGLGLFSPNKYAASATIYPYNSYTKNDIVNNPQFGAEFETEQLMQLLESESMMLRTIEKFKLYSYYHIDTNIVAWRAQIKAKYTADVVFVQTKYLSISVMVRSNKPELAAAIANFQISEVNKYREHIFEANRLQEFGKVKREFETSKQQLDSLKEQIYSTSPDKGASLYAFFENLNNQDFDASSFIKSSKNEMEIEAFVYQFRRFQSLRDKYDQLSVLMKEPLPKVYKIDSALPNYNPTNLSLFLQGCIGAFAFLCLGLVGVFVAEKFKQYKQL